jgi:hypothetical protein
MAKCARTARGSETNSALAPPQGAACNCHQHISCELHSKDEVPSRFEGSVPGGASYDLSDVFLTRAPHAKERGEEGYSGPCLSMPPRGQK